MQVEYSGTGCGIQAASRQGYAVVDRNTEEQGLMI